jgi:hypothetical protein
MAVWLHCVGKRQQEASNARPAGTVCIGLPREEQVAILPVDKVLFTEVGASQQHVAVENAELAVIHAEHLAKLRRQPFRRQPSQLRHLIQQKLEALWAKLVHQLGK